MMQAAEPQQQHHWLQQLVGDWTYDMECPAGPDQPPMKCSGSERVRALGGLWVVCEGRGEMPGGGEAFTLMTIGFDPQKQRFVGCWVGSMMTHMWHYEGTLDATRKVLPLETEGPDCSNPDKFARYRDVIEMLSSDHRTLTSFMQGEDGEWRHFMTAHYRRKK
jgi:hypothetical protein